MLVPCLPGAGVKVMALAVFSSTHTAGADGTCGAHANGIPFPLVQLPDTDKVGLLCRGDGRCAPGEPRGHPSSRIAVSTGYRWPRVAVVLLRAVCCT
jgi:hypothetical protein